MEKLKLYYIENNYIEYLRKFDSKVAYNKIPNRPYIGVVYTYNNFKYFAPLSSPKEKHIKMNNNVIDLFKIKNGELGVINLNNMIPCPEKVLHEIIPIVKDDKYKKLLENQITEINSKRENLYKKVYRFQREYRNNRLFPNILNRCCNFILLEQKCIEYK